MKASDMNCVTVEDVLRLREHAIATEKERDQLREALQDMMLDMDPERHDKARAALKATEPT